MHSLDFIFDESGNPNTIDPFDRYAPGSAYKSYEDLMQLPLRTSFQEPNPPIVEVAKNVLKHMQNEIPSRKLNSLISLRIDLTDVIKCFEMCESTRARALFLSSIEQKLAEINKIFAY